MKKLLAAIMSVTLLIALFTCEVSAADETPEDGLSEEWYHIPKEKMVFDGEFPDVDLEPLYAYIAIVIKDNYLDPNGISYDGYVLDCGEKNALIDDLIRMQVYYSEAIKYGEISPDLEETYLLYNPDDFKLDPDISEAILGAMYTYCKTAGVDEEEYLDALIVGNELFSPENIVFSEERLHYFDD